MICVSVIMPCLNMEKYLYKCLDSVVNQTLKDIEIIVVDAGSEDNSLNIIKEFMDLDSRIRLIHANKKSYGYQINLGVSMAKGDYIGIVETDDYIELNMYEVLYYNIYQTDAEYIKACADKYFEKNSWSRRFEFIPCKELDFNDYAVLRPRKTPRLFYSDNFIWNGIYRRDFISKFRLSETYGAAFQDIGLLFKVISNAHKGIYVKQKVYNYRQNNGLSSSFSHRGLNFIRYEYNAIENTLYNMDYNWKSIFFHKLAAHVLGCFYTMACENCFWQESLESFDWLESKIKYAIQNRIISKECFDDPKEWEYIKLFIQDKYMLFEKCKELFLPPANFTKKSLAPFGKNDWIIFGFGIRGKKVYEILKDYPIMIRGFCDNVIDKQGKFHHGLPIWSLTESLIHYPKAYFLVPNKLNHNEILSQLQEAGVPCKRIMIAFEELCYKFIYNDLYTLKILLYDES